MTHDLPILAKIRIASPCSVPWASMEGDNHTRFCGKCRLNVFNLSMMTREAAETLIRQREGRLCVAYYQRSDGTILTSDCPVGLIRLRRRLSRVAAGFGLLLCGLFGVTPVLAGRIREQTWMIRLRSVSPFRFVVDWLDPPRFAVGAMASLRRISNVAAPAGDGGTATSR